MPADKSPLTRLKKALSYLQMVRTSRELDYGAVPYVVAAEKLIDLAIEKQSGLHS